MGGRDVSQDHCSPEGPTPWAEPRPSPAPADRSPESGGRPRARPPSRRRPVHVRGCRRQVRAAAPRAAPVRGGRSRASRPCPLEGAGRTGTWGRRGGSEATAGPWGLPGRRRGRAPDRPFVRRGARPPRPAGMPNAARAPRPPRPADPRGRERASRRGGSGEPAPGSDASLLCHATCSSLPGVPMATTKMLPARGAPPTGRDGRAFPGRAAGGPGRACSPSSLRLWFCPGAAGWGRAVVKETGARPPLYLPNFRPVRFCILSRRLGVSPLVRVSGPGCAGIRPGWAETHFFLGRGGGAPRRNF